MLSNTLPVLTSVLPMLLLHVFAVQAQEIPALSHTLSPAVGSAPAPDLKLPDLDDEIIDLATFRGQVVVINFWATWCPPCRREMPALSRMAFAVSEDDVVTLTVNIGEDFETIFGFTGSLDMDADFPFLLDTHAVTLKSWDIKGLPTTYIIDKDGRLAYRAVGGREFDHPKILETPKSLASR